MTLAERFGYKPLKLTPTNYYVFTYSLDEGIARISEQPWLPPFYNNWRTGVRIDIKLPQPLEYAIDEVDEGILSPYYEELDAPLMSNKLIKALTECGIDNLDIYEATIRLNRTGEIIHDYKAVNIIGLVKAADMDKSEYSTNGLNDKALFSVWFNKLVIDEAAIQNLSFFRMAENVSIVLIHKHIKEKIETQFPQLKFVHPLQYSG